MIKDFQIALSAFHCGELVKAQKGFKKIISHCEHGPSYLMLGLVEKAANNITSAERYFKDSIRIDPENADSHCHLAILYMELNRKLDAFPLFQAAEKRNPKSGPALGNLAILFKNLGRLNEAEDYAKRAVEAEPNRSEHFSTLADILTNQARHVEASICYKKAIEINTFCDRTRSNYLLSLLYTSTISIDDIFDQHKLWDKHHSYTPLVQKKLFPNKLRLKIGYVSRDFRRHSVAFFIEPILYNHNRQKFDIFCYSDVQSPDEVTRRLKTLCTQWRDTFKMDDEKLAKIIQDDDVDILVDLGAHAGSRLKMFSKKPSPVQISYLGYPYTTGLPTMDFRITDKIADPSTEDKFYTEKLIRLSNCFVCFAPPHSAPEVSQLPHDKNGFLTFGSCNNLAKYNDDIVKLWARLLLRVPRSKLILKNKNLSEKEVTDRISNLFKGEGVNSKRIVFKGFDKDIQDHLAFYNNIDIALDTFPYNGTTTTCESLWMGVPVLTLEGEHHVSRVGCSLLSVCRLQSFIAKTKRDYLGIAVYLNDNVEIIRDIRLKLRSLMAETELCNGQTFTAKLESTYEKLSSACNRSLQS